MQLETKDLFIPKYDDVIEDILDHKHTHYVFEGGRGGTKSSAIGKVIPLVLIQNPTIHATVFRKVGKTMKSSVFNEIVSGIYMLGLREYFHIPKSIANPIIYKPTGQQILFIGLDDPMKVKSLKMPFGYVGIMWFEELDQYNGEAEIRNVTQSTMRGGDIFWDFRSFNPPISINNWANEYAEQAKDRDDTLVIHTTYLDVPKEWLGSAFIKEAEILKEINHKAYEHEYLGIPVGTGGAVFPNVKHMDMTKLVDISSPYDKEPIKVPLWQTFDKIYTGLDWGFTVDPTRLVRCHYDIKKMDLYIFYEYNTTGTRNINIFEDIYEKEGIVSTQDLVVADSAEQKSIADFKAYGAFIRGAEKGAESVRYGIKWLQGRRNIYIDKNLCPRTYKEFIKYEYMQDREGNFISEVPDKDNHSIDACRYALEKFYKHRGK